jgi:hypothetical protein
MTIAFTALGLTSPLSNAAIAVGRPGVDLPYATVALLGLAAAALVGGFMDSTPVFLVGYLGTLSGSVLIFFSYAPRMARTGLARREFVD